MKLTGTLFDHGHRKLHMIPRDNIDIIESIAFPKTVAFLKTVAFPKTVVFPKSVAFPKTVAIPKTVVFTKVSKFTINNNNFRINCGNGQFGHAF